MRRMDRSIWLSMVASLTAAAPACAAPACEALPTDGSPLGYHFRDDVPRCEGTYTSPVAGEPGIALVSLTLGQVVFDAAADPTLEIGFAAPPLPATRIRAVNVPQRRYYRLDADPPTGQAGFRLPLGDVVRPLHFGPDDFGVFGTRATPDGDAYVPVWARRPGAAAEPGIVAVLRPGWDVSDIVWRLVVPGGGVPPWAPVPGGSGYVPQGQRLELKLGADLPARATLDLSYYISGTGRTDHFVLLAR